MQTQLFEDLPPARPNRSVSGDRSTVRADRTPSAPNRNSVIPGLDTWLAETTARIADEESEAFIRDRLQSSLDEYGHSSSMSVGSAVALYQAVLARAYKDAIGLDLLLTNDEGGEDERAVQRRGIDYFIRGDGDFRTVCDYADFDADTLRLRVLEQLGELGLISDVGGSWVINADSLGRLRE